MVLGCGGFGFLVANSIKKECDMLRQLITALDFILCEINYRMTPLPELFRMTSAVCSGILCRFFLILATELDRNSISNADICITESLKQITDMPKDVRRCLQLLAKTIGTFDLSGQIKALEAVKSEANRLLTIANENQHNRLKCYKTLGLSAGAALVIIFI